MGKSTEAAAADAADEFVLVSKTQGCKINTIHSVKLWPVTTCSDMDLYAAALRTETNIERLPKQFGTICAFNQKSQRARKQKYFCAVGRAP